MDHKHEIMRLYREEHFTEREIAKKLLISRSTVHYWVAKLFQVYPTNKKGRQRCTNQETDNKLYAKTIDYPFVTGNILQRELSLGCSTTTIRRRLKERKLKCRIPARKLLLTDAHKQKRFEFAQNHLEWNIDRWKQIVFSDEKIFRASSRGPMRVYRPHKSDRYDPKYIVYSKDSYESIHVWMAFGGPICKIHRITGGTLNSVRYTQEVLPLIEEDLVQHNLIFMQDRSSVHMAKTTRRWLDEHNISWLEDWPTKGPDMNPVENVWAELVKRSRKNPKTKEEIWENVLEAFNALPATYFDKLVESMPRRIQMVVEKQGNWSKY